MGKLLIFYFSIHIEELNKTTKFEKTIPTAQNFGDSKPNDAKIIPIILYKNAQE
tara:strand:- start:32 stop:193 length:162 start_codon:yes stop_codon:yes gene_type:complete